MRLDLEVTRPESMLITDIEMSLQYQQLFSIYM